LVLVSLTTGFGSCRCTRCDCAVCALCSDDIVAHILGQGSSVRLSLYISSQLMYGAVVVYRRQQHYLVGLSVAYDRSVPFLSHFL